MKNTNSDTCPCGGIPVIKEDRVDGMYAQCPDCHMVWDKASLKTEYKERVPMTTYKSMAEDDKRIMAETAQAESACVTTPHDGAYRQEKLDATIRAIAALRGQWSVMIFQGASQSSINQVKKEIRELQEAKDKLLQSIGG